MSLAPEPDRRRSLLDRLECVLNLDTSHRQQLFRRVRCGAARLMEPPLRADRRVVVVVAVSVHCSHVGSVQ